jgi:hypothetical protein
MIKQISIVLFIQAVNCGALDQQVPISIIPIYIIIILF